MRRAARKHGRERGLHRVERRPPRRHLLLHVHLREVLLQQELQRGGGGKRADAHLEAVRDGLALEREVLHVPVVRHLVFRAARGARGSHRLHGERAHHEALAELAHFALVARGTTGRVGERVAQRTLHELPRERMDGLRADEVGDDPVRAGRNLRDEVGVAARGHLLRRGGGNGAVDDTAERGLAVHRLLHAVLGDGGAVGGVAVHRGGRTHDHVAQTQLAARALRKVVDHARTDGNRDCAVRGSDGLAHLLHLRVGGVEIGAVGIDDMLGDVASGGLQEVDHARACDGPRTRVVDDDRLPRFREQRAEHPRGGLRRARPDLARLRVGCLRQRLFDHRHRSSPCLFGFFHSKTVDGTRMDSVDFRRPGAVSSRPCTR